MVFGCCITTIILYVHYIIYNTTKLSNKTHTAKPHRVQTGDEPSAAADPRKARERTKEGETMKHLTIAEYNIMRTYRNLKVVSIHDGIVLVKFL